MFASWIPTPPYVIKRRRSSEPRGLIPDLLAHMLQESCGTCFSYKTWNISYTINTSASITEPDKFTKVDFRFPVRSAVGRTTYRGFHTYVPLITVPGVALMTRKKTPSGYARDLGHSVLGCWPIFAVSIVLAVLTGVIIWFAVSDLSRVRDENWIYVHATTRASSCVRASARVRARACVWCARFLDVPRLVA